MSSTDELPPFPVLQDEPQEPFTWPRVPFDWLHAVPAHADDGQPCRIETASGTDVDGYFLGMDLAAAALGFRSCAEGAPVRLAFSRFRKLSLTSALVATKPSGGGIADRLPIASQGREYRVLSSGGAVVMRGDTVGLVEAEEGHYFFEPAGDDWSLRRVFVPRSPGLCCELGPTARERAAHDWIVSREALLKAAERRRQAAVLPIGQSLIDLGLVTQAQIDRALADPTSQLALGERLVEMRVITQSDLDTAIAHKMGYPIVDLARFPIDRNVARALPLRMAIRYRSLPLFIDGERMVVCVDKPSRLAMLEKLYALAGHKLVGVLASKGSVLQRLSSLSLEDVWPDGVLKHPSYYADSGF